MRGSLLFLGLILLVCGATVAALVLFRPGGLSSRPRTIDVRDAL